MPTSTALHGNHTQTEAWFEDYLSQVHQQLGRDGNVCPFVRPALNAQTLVMESIHYEDAEGLAQLCAQMRRQIDRFAAMRWPHGKEGIAALVTVIDAMPAHRWALLAEPAALNPGFPVSRSPEPLFAVRHMALHDILFLHGSPPMFAQYRKRFDHFYHRADRPVPETYRRLYAMAQQRGEGRSEYIDYQSIDILLSLQNPHTDHPAEMSFYLSGQVKELLFKLLHEQARAVRVELASDHVDEAIWGLRRLRAALDALTRLWDVLGTLSPTEFNAFREQLGGASGIDSYMFRMVEFILGRKSAALASRYASIPGVAEDVYRSLHDSSVYDEALAVLVRQGLLASDAAAAASRDADAVTAAWADVYRRHGPSDAVFRLAEALVDVADGFARWRALHLLTAERMIGSKPGTGGTDGVAWLRKSAEHRFFPELWAARTLLH
jgi:tryptophan 2,3-dioxygenase